jgi:lactaldehyde dehydrogenase/glycolaldehyde dehydrogenase
VLEQGKPLNQAEGEIDAVVTFLTYAAESARRIEGDILPSDFPNEEVWIRRVPFGVVVGADGLELPGGARDPQARARRWWPATPSC